MMRFFTLHEFARDGITVGRSKDGPVFLPGAISLPLSKERIAEFENFAVDQKDLTCGDISTNEPIRITTERAPTGDEDPADSQCLVHVCTRAGIGGQLWYETISYKEELNAPAGFVQRVHGEIDPKSMPAGVELIGWYNGQQEEHHMLIRMWRNSGFLILRDGEVDPADNTRVSVLYENGERLSRSNALVIGWTGSELHCRPPRRPYSAKKVQQHGAAHSRERNERSKTLMLRLGEVLEASLS